MQGKDSAAEVLKPSLADMAAVSIEMWSGLEHTGSSADVSLETAKEAAALRFLLLEERKRVKKELRPLKHAWETAERRASGLEHELLLVRCTQSLLSKEIGEADALSSWWRGQYTLEEFRSRLTVVPRLREATVADAGHMLHHDQPDAVAALIAEHVGD